MPQFQEDSLPWVLRWNAGVGVRYKAQVLSHRVFAHIKHWNVQLGSDWKFSFHRFGVTVGSDMKPTKFMFTLKKKQTKQTKNPWTDGTFSFWQRLEVGQGLSREDEWNRGSVAATHWAPLLEVARIELWFFLDKPQPCPVCSMPTLSIRPAAHCGAAWDPCIVTLHLAPWNQKIPSFSSVSPAQLASQPWKWALLETWCADERRLEVNEQRTLNAIEERRCSQVGSHSPVNRVLCPTCCCNCACWALMCHNEHQLCRAVLQILSFCAMALPLHLISSSSNHILMR